MSKKILIFVIILILSISLSNAIKTITINETELVSLEPKASDEDADTLFYSFTEPLDEEGKWQTNYGDSGEYTITVTASDGYLSTSQDVLLIVNKKNIGPVIDSFFPEESELMVDEGGSIDFNIKASDLNKDLLEYEWKFDGEIVSTEESYTYKADYFDEGEHRVRVLVSDGEEEDEKEWIVTVNNVDRKYLLDNIPSEIVVDEGDTIKLDLPDFEKYNLEYTISEPMGDDGKWETDYDDAGVYDVDIIINDREFSAAKTIDVEVIDKDRKPIFKPIANALLKENQKVVIELEVEDPDGDEVEIYAENLPEGSSLIGNRFEWVTNYDTVKKENVFSKTLDKFHLLYKPFNVRFVAKSRELEVKRSVVLTVKDVNRAPLLMDFPSIVVNEGEEVVIEPVAEDPDGDEITYSYSGWMDTDRYMTDYDTAGTYKVKVVASDGFLKDEKYAMIIVEDVNRIPVFSEIPAMEVSEGELLEMSLYAGDEDGDSVEITGEFLPRNATVEDNVFRWVPDHDIVNTGFGVFVIDFKASDGRDEVFKQANVTVYDVNRAPIVIGSSGQSITVNEGEKVKFEVMAEDLDGDELTYLWKFSFLEHYKSGPAMIRTFVSTGNKKVRVVVSDKEEEVEFVFNVKVV